MPTEPDSPEGYVSYDDLFIVWMAGYLHNYIGCFPCQHDYIILEWLHLAFLKLSQNPIQTHSNEGKFCHPVLSDNEHVEVCKLGIDSWADTYCAGKHAFVEEFIEGKSVKATGFKSSLLSLSNLPITNVVYAYHAPDGTAIILECNNLICLGQKMSDSLLNPIQTEEVGARVDTGPKWYEPNEAGCKSINFPDGKIIPVLYEGVIPYIPICRPTK